MKSIGFKPAFSAAEPGLTVMITTRPPLIDWTSTPRSPGAKGWAWFKSIA
jgi:hypothetical protein